MVHMPFVPLGYWSPIAPLIDLRFASSHVRKQHPRHEEAVSSTSLAEAVYAWTCESISRGRANTPPSRLYQGIEKAVSRTSLTEAIYAWPCESISRGRADSPHSRPYQGIWGRISEESLVFLNLHRLSLNYIVNI
ncbi:unnamed protein product [Schistosoma margrebowiei]|uniref:Uncharacterized protein n=1 Tax=Schistosoma margrebowiei TaxID=48269 RepID=A0A3P8A363_9TREM|nr:unnamed protein product [Schistosoma margrebowiei]